MDWGPSRIWRVIFLSSFITVAATVLSTHLVGTLYPLFVIGSTIVFCLLLIGVFYSPPSSYYVAIITVSIALLLRLYVVWFEPTPYGVDTYKYIAAVGRVLDTGTGGIQLAYYDQAPLFIIVPSVFSLLSGLSPDEAYLIQSIIVAIGIPITGATMYSQVAETPTPRDITIAVIAVAAVDRYANYVYLPIANIYALIMLFLLLSAIVIYLRSWGSSHARFIAMFPIIVLMLGIFFTHKLAQFLLLGSLGVLIVQVYLSKYNLSITPRSNLSSRAVIGIMLITGVYLFIHSLIVTDLAQIAVSIVLISIDSLFGSASMVETTPGYSRFIRHSFLDPTTAAARGSLLTVIVGVPATVFIFYTRHRIAVQFFAIFAGVTLLLGIVAISELERFITSAQLILVVFTTFIALRYYHRHANLARYIIPGFFILFIISNMFSAPAVPGYADMAELHRNAAEVRGVEWAAKYHEGFVYTDEYTTRVLKGAGDPDGEYLRSAQTFYFSGGFSGDRCPPTVLHRTQYDTHWGPGMIEIIWDPDRQLSQAYDNVYSNGAATYYTNPVCG